MNDTDDRKEERVVMLSFPKLSHFFFQQVLLLVLVRGGDVDVDVDAVVEVDVVDVLVVLLLEL